MSRQSGISSSSDLGIDHRARQDVRADFRALFEHADRDVAALFGRELLQPDRRRQARRPRADDHHVVRHRFAFAHPIVSTRRSSHRDNGLSAESGARELTPPSTIDSMGMTWGLTSTTDWRASVASALEWWRDAGVDCEIDDAPRDWLARMPVAGQAAGRGARRAAPRRRAAGNAGRIRRVAARRRAPEAGWPGKALGTQGDAASGLMIAGRHARSRGRRGGRVAVGHRRAAVRPHARGDRARPQSVYLTALAREAPARRPRDRRGRAKLEALIRHHLSLAAPKRVLALGNAASRAMHGDGRRRARGSLRVVNHDGGTSEVVASFHPRFLLERPAAKADAWKDLKMLIGGLE